MKKILIALAAAFVAAGVLMASVTTNRQGQVLTTTVGTDGVATTIVVANGAASVTNRTVLPVGAQLDKSTVTTTTDFTPRNYGDFLIGKSGAGTNGVWCAAGLTTSDWVRLSPAD